MTLRYEDLVTEPARELGRVCEPIGEAFEPGMLDSREPPPGDRWRGEHEWWKEGGDRPARRVARRALATRDVGR